MKNSIKNKTYIVKCLTYAGFLLIIKMYFTKVYNANIRKKNMN